MIMHYKLRLIAMPIILVISLLVMALLGWSAQRFLTEFDQGEISQSVMIAAEAVKYTLVDAETGERGYIITGDKRYLEPYNNALAVIENQLLDLRLKMNQKIAEDSSVYSITVLAHNKLGELDKAIKLYDSKGFAAAQASLMTYTGKQEMDDVRSIVQNIQNVEERRVIATTAITKGLARITLCCCMMLIICIVCLFVVWFGNPFKTNVIESTV